MNKSVISWILFIVSISFSAYGMEQAHPNIEQTEQINSSKKIKAKKRKKHHKKKNRENVKNLSKIPEKKEDDPIITLKVSGELFEIPMSNLVSYDSMLKTLVTSGLTSKTDKNGYLLLQADSEQFKKIVYWLRYSQVSFDTISDAISCYNVADYLLLDALKQYISYWINLNKEWDKNTALTWIGEHPLSPDPPTAFKDVVPYVLEYRGKQLGYLQNDGTWVAIGGVMASHPRYSVEECWRAILYEYDNRNHHKQLVFVPDQNGQARVFNIRTNKMIGYPYEKAHAWLANSSYPAMALKKSPMIRNAIKNYICAKNQQRTYSIYHTETGAVALGTKTYKNSKACLFDLRLFTKDMKYP